MFNKPVVIVIVIVIVNSNNLLAEQQYDFRCFALTILQSMLQ